MSSRSVYLRTSSHDHSTLTSNSQYRVNLEHWPVQLNDGVRGVSLESIAFPNNAANITSENNIFYWDIKGRDTHPIRYQDGYDFDVSDGDDAKKIGDRIIWRYRTSLSDPYSDWITFDLDPSTHATWNMTTMSGGIIDASDLAVLTGLLGGHITSYVTGSPVLGFHFRYTDDWRMCSFEIEPSADLFIEFDTETAPDTNIMKLLGFDNGGIVATEHPTWTSGHVSDILSTRAPFAFKTVVPPGQYDIDTLLDYISQNIQLQSIDYAAGIPQFADLNPVGGDMIPLIQQVPHTDLTPVSHFGHVGDFRSNGHLAQTLWGDNPGTRLVYMFYSGTHGSTLGPVLGISNLVMGITDHETFNSLPNLYGNSMVYLHSSIIAGRTTIDGDGGIISVVKPIPITVPHRHVQAVSFADSGIPNILFPRKKFFTDVNITLRDGHGRPVDIGSGELEVVWKLYY